MSTNISEIIEKLLFDSDEKSKPSQKLPIISEGITKSNAYESEILSYLSDMLNRNNSDKLMKYFHKIKNENEKFLSNLSSQVIKHIIALNDIEKEILEYKKENEEEE